MSGGSLRLTVRQLAKQPGYAAACVMTLALAIGATAAMFSAIYAIVLRPLPIRTPHELVVVWGADTARGLPVVELTYRNFEAWAASSRTFTSMTAMGSSNWTAILDLNGTPARVPYAAVTASFFDTLGAPPLLGRTFRSGDDVPNAAGVIVLNYGAWVRRFGARRDAIGATIRLDGRAYTIVGVMPKGFDFPRAAEFWMPVVPGLAAASSRWNTDALANVGVLFVVGRMQSGATLAGAARDLDALAQQSNRPNAPRFGSSVVATPFFDYFLGPVRTALWVSFAAVAILLLIACANVSALMLTRVAGQRRERAIRFALGATRNDVAAAWLREVAVLSAIGGLLGLTTSKWIVAAITALAPDDVPRLADVAVNGPVAAFTLGVVLLTASLCGIGTLRGAAASNVQSELADGAYATDGGRSGRTRSLLVSAQIALAVTLLVAAGLLVRSFQNLRAMDLGFTPDRVLTMNVTPEQPGSSPNLWIDELLRSVAALPEVEAAGAIFLPPLALGPIGQETHVLRDGQPNTPAAWLENPALNYQVATADYFRAMRIVLKRGRLFTPRDDARAPRVAIVSESTARQLWPGMDPIGRRIAMPSFKPRDASTPWRTVVGVVADVRYRGIADVRLDVYDPALQAAQAANDLVVRTTGDPLAIVAAVQARARELDAHVVVDRIGTMDAIVSRAVAPWRLNAWMLTMFAAVAFALAAVGLFSTVALNVAGRRRELAVRVALGAVPSSVVRSVLMRSAAWAAAGIIAGLGIAAAAARALGSMLYGVDTLDATTYATVAALVACVVAIASFLPARRAAAIDPMLVLRGE